jgi:hypothetical protein
MLEYSSEVCRREGGKSTVVARRSKIRMPGRQKPLMGTMAGGRGKRNLACDYFLLALRGHSSREPK